jgi:hypothetical protein
MGVYPAPFLSRSQESVSAIQRRVTGGDAGGTIVELNEKEH